jgi:hypothetical protein
VTRLDYNLRPAGNWNDVISSITPTPNLCAYFEEPNLSGTIRIVLPNVSVFDLDFLGFDNIISSVINYGPP